MYKLSKMKTAPVKKRLDCLIRQDQKVLFISFVVFAEQRTTVKLFVLLMISFDKKLVDLTVSDKQSKFTHGEERPLLVLVTY